MAIENQTEDSNIDQINNLIKTEENAESKDQARHIEQKHAEKQINNYKKSVPKQAFKQPIKHNVVEKPKSHKHVHRHKTLVLKKPYKQKSQEKKSYIWILAILAIIVIAVVAFLLFKVNTGKPDAKPTISEVAATVNGEPIYLADIDAQYNSLNPMLQQIYTKEQILNQTIDELLLIQEAKNQNIKASDTEIEQELRNFKQQNALTDQDFNDLLEKQNITLTQLKALISKRLQIKDLLNATIFKNINISDSDIENYYFNNKDQFSTPEAVTASHILIMINDTQTDDNAFKLISDINNKLDDTNFCELAKQYSEDLGSKNTCGTYTFGKGEMVQEFEDASFSLAINATKIVKTQYGYHLIKKLAYNKADILPLEDVASDIRQKIYDATAQKNFDVFLNELRAKAKIVNYMIESPAAETNTAATIDSGDSVVNPPEPRGNLDEFAQCLTEKGAKFYGATWCPHCTNQKELFGDSFKYVVYVECADKDNPQVQTPECEAAGISGYPTWIINDKQYPGEQTLEGLAKLTGCEQ
ncbi:TPA: hypothetical protein HA363_00925 [Candidatus Woesearchaeota archaeon]|nr:hypothetical protein [Candidatus Woesearchaeota archaeon]